MKKGNIVAIGGGGFDDGEMMPVFERIMALSGKAAPRAIYLPTANFDSLDAVPMMEGIFMGLGCSSFEALTLSKTEFAEGELRQKLLDADIIFASGGNLKFLMDTWNAVGATEIMREAFELGKVLCGVSSGAMCWFDEGWDDCGENGAFMFIDCVGLLHYCNCPHFEDPYWHRFTDTVKDRPYSGIACENGAALVYCDGVYEAVHGVKGGKVWLLDKNDSCTLTDLSEVDLSIL
ncbi:MAG: Type 1 glutamine amidotransferase-like domain-containing protein [Clostridia bacterium]|nr:Type 1 glutamine amidotransferase-like domain-containing protein [Clostridia bacterium]